MKVCSDVVLEKWTPNFSSSGQASPTWTRSRCSGVEICNSLGWVDWITNPVQVILCDAWGYEDCASGGYVHVSYLDGLILWTAPQIDTGDDWAVGQYAAAPALRRLGAIAIPKGTWDGWRAVMPELPEVSAFSAPNVAVVADAWSLGPGRPTRLNELVPMLQARLLGCDTVDTGDAIDRVTALGGAIDRLSGLGRQWRAAFTERNRSAG
jgi:hypothetical protein